MEVDDDVQLTPQKGGASPTNPLSTNAFVTSGRQNLVTSSRPNARPPGGVTSISFGDYMGPTATPAASPAPVKSAQQVGAPATPTQPTTPESAESVPDAPAPIPMMELPTEPEVENEEDAGEEEQPAAVVAPVLPPSAPAKPEPAAAPKIVSSNAFASGTHQNSGNVMTGRPSTRVRAPPGGASSITFG